MLLLLLCIYCFSPPPSFLPIEVATVADASPLFDYMVDDRVPLPSSYQASSAPSPLPYIAYLSIFICCTRHLLLLCYCPILMHSLSLSPLMHLPFSYAAYYIILYSAVNPVNCKLGLDSRAVITQGSEHGTIYNCNKYGSMQTP